ncbi:MAG: M23 family metallopeptidase [Candidatus Acidiferrales bacterium]
MRRSSICCAGALVAIVSLCVPVRAFGQTRVAWAARVDDCGGGVFVRVVPASVGQGGLIRLEVSGAAAFAGVTGEWTQHEAPRAIPFWRDSKSNKKYYGLLGVDLEKPVGKYDLRLMVQPAAGEAVICKVPVSVAAGRFAVERLKVAPQFVEPNAEETKRANEERDRLRGIFATVTPTKLWVGTFRLPLPGIHTARNFGRRRVLNGTPSSPHSGVDIPAPAGTPIHASQRGRVVLAENLYFSGNTVVIDHGLGVYTFYGHMRTIGVQVGDIVPVGGVLGRVGSTGRATGPHLHWGLTVDDSRVNALQIVGPLGS